MSYQLSRLRLVNIGDRAARFPDVTLDFTSPTSVTAEPLDSITWLRNGGGKSSLLSLFFAVLLPLRKDFLGASMKRYIEDYIAAGDTSHTAAEWADASDDVLFGGAGTNLVTGVLYEWDERRKPADPERNKDKLKVSYYSFFATPGVLTLDTLPMDNIYGKPATRAEVVKSLREIATAHPQQLQLVITDAPNQWMTTLTERGLDPELFRYQKKMNHSEGGVADLFNFETSAKFIDFLIDLTVDADQPDRVASNLRAVADVLAAKPRHQLGLEFCATLAAKLDTVDAEYRGTELAREERKGLRAAVGKLAAELTMAGQLHRLRTAQLDQQIADDEVALAEANRARNRLNALANELLLAVARFQLADREAELAVARRTAMERSAQVRAWEAVTPLAQMKDAAERAERLRRQLETQEEANAPRREARDAAAVGLRARYRTLGRQESSERERVAGQLTAARELAGDLRSQQREAGQSLAGAQSDIRHHLQSLDAIGAALTAAVSRGDLPHEVADPAEVSSDAERSRQSFSVERELLRVQRAERAKARTALNTSRTDLSVTHSTAASTRQTLAADRTVLSARAKALAADHRLCELTELEPDDLLDLWAQASTLRGLLAKAAADGDARVINSGVDGADDTRALAALSQGGYLPQTRDAQRAGDLLAGAGVAARPGWELLRDIVPPANRAAALRNPHVAALSAGLVVADDDAAAALAALAERRVEADGHVTVATAAALESALAGGHPGWAVVSPTPALYDAQAADVARTERTESAKHRAANERAWTERATADRVLLGQLETFLSDCPTGHLATLDADIAGLDAELDRLSGELADLSRQLEELDVADRAGEARSSELATLIERAAARISRLESLAATVAGRPGLATALADAETLHGQLEAEVDALDLAAAEQERLRDELQAEYAARDESARRYAAAGAAIALLGGTRAAAAESADTAASDADPALLETLRTRFEDASRDWDQVAADSVLAERLSAETKRLAAATEMFDGSDEPSREQARALLATAEGQDPARRAGALAAARDLHEAAARAAIRAEVAVETAGNTVAEAERTRTRERRPAELDIVPTDEQHAQRLADEAAAEATERSTEVTDRGRRIEQGKAERGEQDKAADLFGQYVRRLEPALTPGPEPSAAVFTGSLTEAEAAVDNALELHETANLVVSDAEERLSKAVRAVSRTASEGRFATLEDPLKARFTTDDADLIARMAASRARDLRERRQVIEGQLADISKDQKLVVTEVAILVSEVLSTLTQAQRQSKLPGSLGEWSDRQFLTISFSKPASDEDLRARIDAVVEQIVAEGSKPEGLSLLKRCVHEAVSPRGFKVTVLKPNSDLIVEPLDITLLGKYSGGEKLTVCVALYCTLARLRATNRGKGHIGGTLMLDNPLGTASHVALLRLQRDVASAHGVQLMYTTGVEDLGAVGQFPNVIRMRNSAGTLRQRRYVTVDVRTFEGHPVADEGRIDGVRVSAVRPAG